MDSCNVVATEHGQDKTVECLSSAVSLYSMLECKKFYYCWTWQIFVEDCGVSSAECCVHLVGVDRVMYC